MFILYFILNNLAGVAIDTYIARTETAKSQLIILLSIVVRIPLVIFICLSFASLIGVAYAYVASAIAMACIALFLIHREHFKWRRPKLFKVYLEFALPISVITIINTISTNIPTIIIGVFSSSNNVALFQSSTTLLSVLGLVGTAVSTLTYPTFSKMYSDGNIEGIRNMTRDAERYISMVTLPIIIFLFVFPTQTAMILFGSSFAPAGMAIRLLALSMLFVLLSQVYSSQILATNHPRTYAKLIVSCFIINIVLLIILIPSKALGSSFVSAAIAVVASNAVFLIATRIIVNRITGTKSNIHILFHVVSAIMTGLFIYALSTFIHLNGLIFIILFMAITLIVFFGIMWLIKELKKEDLNYAIDTINFRKMREICALRRAKK